MKTFVECPQCKEVACVTKSSFITTIDCECGVLKVDTMIEGDRHYETYNNYLNSCYAYQYGATLSPVFTDDNEGRISK